jgi:OPA family glycerol-3-phosphate transporter-like MFS transporter
MVSSFFFFAYMIGQTVHGFLSRRANSVAFVGGALLVSAALNMCMPFAASTGAMKALWLMNGIVQSALWPNLIKIMTEKLPVNRTTGALVLMNTTGAVGSVVVYLVAAGCIKWFSWRVAFFIPAGILLLFALLWYPVMTMVHRKIGPSFDVPPPEGNQKRNGSNIFRILIGGGILLVALAAIGNGFLRDGMATWLPGYMQDVFHIETTLAVFISIIIPLSQIGGAFFANKLYTSIGNPFLTTLVLFAITLGSSVLILAAAQHSIVLTCICFAVCATMMTAVNTMLVSIIPLMFRAQRLTSLVSGCVNSFVYAGSLAAAFAFGKVADISGWNAVLYMICAASVISMFFCMLSLRKIK